MDNFEGRTEENGLVNNKILKENCFAEIKIECKCSFMLTKTERKWPGLSS